MTQTQARKAAPRKPLIALALAAARRTQAQTATLSETHADSILGLSMDEYALDMLLRAVDAAPGDDAASRERRLTQHGLEYGARQIEEFFGDCGGAE